MYIYRYRINNVHMSSQFTQKQLFVALVYRQTYLDIAFPVWLFRGGICYTYDTSSAMKSYAQVIHVL